MRRIYICLFVLLFSVNFKGDAFAQANISINDVAKIYLQNSGGGLHSYYQDDYVMVFENGQWNSYQTREKYDGINNRIEDPKKMFERKDTTIHKFIKVVPQDSITFFLSSLSTIKPTFILTNLKISIPKLTQQIDTAILKKLDKKRIQIFNSYFDTPDKLYHLLDTIQYDYIFDYSPHSNIEIIKKQGDTVKLDNRIQTGLMLPWRVNGKPSFDFNINQFFVTATGLVKHQMTGKYIYKDIADRVYLLYADDAFERLRAEELAKENFNYIREHFDIVKLNPNNGKTSFSFRPKQLDKHFIIRGTLDFSNKSQLVDLVKFAEDTISGFIKRRGFVTDSCMAKPGCTITFSNNNGQGYHKVTFFKKGIGEEYLKRYESKNLLPFEINTGDRIIDSWISLPDGNFVLKEYLDNYAVGVKSVYIKKDMVQMRKFVFMLFDHDGKLILDGTNATRLPF